MQWMHSHSEVPRNELADHATKEATQLNSGTPNTSPINFEVANAIILQYTLSLMRHTANKSRSEIKLRKNRKYGSLYKS